MTLEAVPSFEAFGEFLERMDPFQAWLRLAQAWWLPWLKAVEGAWLPAPTSPNPPARSDARARDPERRPGY